MAIFPKPIYIVGNIKKKELMLITSKTRIETSPTIVIYRTPLAFSTVVIKIIILSSENPRIMAYSEDLAGQTPMSLFLDEIMFYIEDAKKRLNIT